MNPQTDTPSPTVAAPDDDTRLARVPRAALAVFLNIAFALPWLLALPLYLGDGLRSPLVAPLSLTTMVTPALAAVIATRVVLRPAHAARFLGLVPLRPAKRLIAFSVAGLLVPPIAAAVALLLAGATGAARLDPTLHHGAGVLPLLTAPLLGVVAAIPAFGEELGWRGFLLPALRPLGTWPTLLLSGAIWGLWHAPLVLLGYNYGPIGGLGLVLMVVFSTLAGFPVSWLRLRSASVWPSTIAHGAIDATGGIVLGALALDPDSAFAGTLLGWAGWVVLAVLGIVLGLAGGYRWAAPRPAKTTGADRAAAE